MESYPSACAACWTDFPPIKNCNATISWSWCRQRRKLKPVSFTTSRARLRSLMAKWLAHCASVCQAAGSFAMVSLIRRIFGCGDTGSCRCSCGCRGSSSNRTSTSLPVAGRGNSSRDLSASASTSSRTRGDIFSVQVRVGNSSAPGSINSRQSCAPGVALLLCGVCPGIHTAYWGGTISIALSTSQVIAPPSAIISCPLRC